MSFWLFMTSSYVVAAMVLIYVCNRYEIVYRLCNRDRDNTVLAGVFWPVFIFVLIAGALIERAGQLRERS